MDVAIERVEAATKAIERVRCAGRLLGQYFILAGELFRDLTRRPPERVGVSMMERYARKHGTIRLIVMLLQAATSRGQLFPMATDTSVALTRAG